MPSCYWSGPSPELWRRCQAGLNKSEQCHALAQVICTHLGAWIGLEAGLG
jgi:TnpA family transposase